MIPITYRNPMLLHAGEDERDDIVGKTHSRTKYSWKRSSFVNSGWKVVSRWRPCRSATIVRGSRGSVSSSSGKMAVCEAGRRDTDMREIIWMGGSVGAGLSPMTTWDQERVNIAHAYSLLWLCKNIPGRG